jgi:hypothetical protein
MIGVARPRNKLREVAYGAADAQIPVVAAE